MGREAETCRGKWRRGRGRGASATAAAARGAAARGRTPARCARRELPGRSKAMQARQARGSARTQGRPAGTGRTGAVRGGEILESWPCARVFKRCAFLSTRRKGDREGRGFTHDVREVPGSGRRLAVCRRRRRERSQGTQSACRLRPREPPRSPPASIS